MFDIGYELFDEEIAIRDVAVGGVDKEASPSLRSDEKEVADFVLVA
jgi:hypothetical protein